MDIERKLNMCSNPPQQKWICRKCGAEGIDTIGEYADDEYERLKREKLDGENIKHTWECGLLKRRSKDEQVQKILP